MRTLAKLTPRTQVLFAEESDAVQYLKAAQHYSPLGSVVLPTAEDAQGESVTLRYSDHAAPVTFTRSELVANSRHGYPVVFTDDGEIRFLNENHLEEVPEQPYVLKLWPWNRAHSVQPMTAGGNGIFVPQGKTFRTITLSPGVNYHVLARLYTCIVQTNSLHTFDAHGRRTGQFAHGETCFLHSVHMHGTGAMLGLVHPDGIVRLEDGSMFAISQQDLTTRGDTCAVLIDMNSVFTG